MPHPQIARTLALIMARLGEGRTGSAVLLLEHFRTPHTQGW